MPDTRSSPPPAHLDATVVAAMRMGSASAAGLAVLAGVAAMAGELFRALPLRTLGVGEIAVQPNAAAGLIAAGAALLVAARGTRPALRLARLLAALAAIVGGATLVEHLSGVDLRIDRVLLPAGHGLDPATLAPGRMGPPAALGLLVGGVAILLLLRGGVRAAQLLALGAAPVPLLGIVGYLYAVPALYGVARVSGIALLAAIGLLALDVAIVLARPAAGAVATLAGGGVGSAVSRRTLLYVVIVPVLLGAFVAAGHRAGAYGGAFALALLVVALAAASGALVLRDAAAIGRIDLANRRAEAERERSREALARALRREREARAAAETASRAKDEFLALLSHELRTPLNAIVGWARVLREGPGDPDRVARGLAVVERNGRALAQLVSDLLDVSRLAAGHLALDAGPVDLARAVGQAVEAVAPAADAKRIRVVRAFAAAPRVRGDAARLEQIAWHLLSNAVKFTPPGGHVEVRLSASAGRAVLEVADDGIGLSPEFLPRLFERFSRADATASRRHGGVGVGLALARRLVELHGGTVAAESGGEGRGATFRVTLPLDPAPEASAEEERARGRARLAGRRILVVEDEDDSRELLLQVLASWGARASGAASAREALDVAARERPEAILSDIAMPGEDGFALLAALRREEAARGDPPVPVAALTAFARPEDRARVLAAGFAAHVAKPIEPDALLDVVGALLGRTPSPESPRAWRAGAAAGAGAGPGPLAARRA